MVAPFDIKRRAVVGPAVPVIERIGRDNRSSWDVSATGTLIYSEYNRRGTKLVRVDRNGSEASVNPEESFLALAKLSRDGRYIAALIPQEISDRNEVFVYDIERNTYARITNGGANDVIWSPGDDGVAFASNRTGSVNLFWQRAGGSGTAELLLEKEHNQFPHDWHPDGKTLAYYEVHPSTARDIWMLTIGSAPEPFLVTPFNERSPVFSPDGQWVAYVSDESGRDEVYVLPYPQGPQGPEGKDKWIISSGGGAEPIWSDNGRELFYRDRYRVFTVPISLNPFDAGAPELLFEGRYTFSASPNGSQTWDAASDRQTFLLRPLPHRPTEINVVLNWFEELKRLDPTDN